MATDHYKTQSVDRVLDIIEYFLPDNQEAKLVDISKTLNLHNSTVHRLITCLYRRGYMDKNKSTQKYRLGAKFIGLGLMVMDNMKIREEVHNVMNELAIKTNKTVHLAIRSGNDIMYLHKVESPNNVVSYTKIGKFVPMYCTAMGKVLLSGFSEKEITDYCAEVEFKKFTTNTISSASVLMTELERVKKNGFATDSEELEAGLKCVAVPICDFNNHIIASMSLSARDNTNNQEHHLALAEELLQTSNKIREKLMYYSIGNADS